MAIEVGSVLAWEKFPIMSNSNNEIYLSCWSSTECRLVHVVPIAIEVDSVLARDIFHHYVLFK